MFTHVVGTFKCLRCAAEQEASIQTYLFKTTYDNTLADYRRGQAEIVDGLEDFDALHPWDGGSPLVLVLGDWDCRACGLGGQWAKTTLAMTRSADEWIGRIEGVETFLPAGPDTFDGVHYVEPWLARLVGFNIDNPPAWRQLSVEQRCAAMAAGFNAWCVEVAGVPAPGA